MKIRFYLIIAIVVLSFIGCINKKEEITIPKEYYEELEEQKKIDFINQYFENMRDKNYIEAKTKNFDLEKYNQRIAELKEDSKSNIEKYYVKKIEKINDSSYKVFTYLLLKFGNISDIELYRESNNTIYKNRVFETENIYRIFGKIYYKNILSDKGSEYPSEERVLNVDVWQNPEKIVIDVGRDAGSKDRIVIYKNDIVLHSYTVGRIHSIYIKSDSLSYLTDFKENINQKIPDPPKLFADVVNLVKIKEEYLINSNDFESVPIAE